MTWLSYKETIRKFCDQLVIIQKPIRILDAIKTPARIREELEKTKFKVLPQLKPEDYLVNGPNFNLDDKDKEFSQFQTQVTKELGKSNPVGHLLVEMAEEYRLVLQMLKHRGRKEFYDFSRKLYGSPQDSLTSDDNTVFEMSRLLYSILSGVKNAIDTPRMEKIYDSEAATKVLAQRFQSYFGPDVARVEVADSILADASAGGDRVRLRAGAMFSQRELEVLEVHEGWVHVGTTLNGKSQKVATWLSIGPPRCAATQEGLAVLMEIFTFRSSVQRAQRVNDRIIAVAKAESGANVLEVLEYFRTEGYTEEDCINNTLRIFRGAPFEGGYPFTKDIAYCKGFVENYNFIRSAIRAHKPYLIPFLFAGKLHTRDLPLIYHLHKEGIVDSPRFLPAHFSDINGIAVWMSFSSFFNKVDLKSVQKHYNKLFSRYSI